MYVLLVQLTLYWSDINIMLHEIDQYSLGTNTFFLQLTRKNRFYIIMWNNVFVKYVHTHAYQLYTKVNNYIG